ncbi:MULTISPECIES: TetR/AcrR family transcriptional regulator [Methylobacterium]|jgi:AcrR family transcriptional regulator|uniref:TetR/AcrR family transcriptional regulator n=1 Tax=Methylobacterium TaxID=407 RepID=UPI0008E4178E|nr:MULTISPECIES: TetR/AcrR family transcriptional regulator [Methylobacterium]MBZ6411559.1 TetR/AcrR family transcriptional regulator [Methylobacterium sp.]MBK3395129.1 TetR/AcrR family transcriptional regulator [Methylobacterium ajmalii]MBK3412083.1 TetR/AcrR family transcriptional regulator [Methylobacterium ajmalii]MBK3424996.1 TetR/AcrR family transcriptional regulator [Methylobacterium ajmalii]SFE39158.1 transcriptional regulator, TetR family [Methylobacterium sp. yr596]
MRNEDRRDRLRMALIDAAEATIAADGLAALKARDLAKEVGCALGAIYTAFPDLDALILTVNLRTLALFERAITEVTIAPPPPTGAASPAERAAAADTLVRLAVGYLHFAAENPARWRALFQHRITQALPDWYLVEQVRLFRYIETPLQVLRPGLGDRERALLARSLFSATHGLVSLGLDEKLMVLSEPVLRGQIEIVVGALGRGLAEG